MGPVAAILMMVMFVLLAIATIKAWSIDSEADPLGVWTARIASTLVTTLLGVAILDSFVADVPMPFAPREKDLPARIAPPERTPDLRFDAGSTVEPSAAGEHRARLRKYKETP